MFHPHQICIVIKLLVVSDRCYISANCSSIESNFSPERVPSFNILIVLTLFKQHCKTFIYVHINLSVVGFIFQVITRSKMGECAKSRGLVSSYNCFIIYISNFHIPASRWSVFHIAVWVRKGFICSICDLESFRFTRQYRLNICSH